MPFSLRFSRLLKILRTSSFEFALGIDLIKDLAISENPLFLMFRNLFFLKKVNDIYY